MSDKISFIYLFNRKRNIIKRRRDIQKKGIRSHQMESGKLLKKKRKEKKEQEEHEESHSIIDLR